MSIRHIRLPIVPASPWKNGAGTTRLLTEQPEWRLSVASITQPARFSSFAGLFRQMGLLTGNGVRLFPVSGAPPLLLDQPGSVIRFSGDLPLTGAPLNGPVDVLNLMRPANRTGPDLTAITPKNLPSDALLGFIAIEEHWDVMAEKQHYMLAPGDILLSEVPFELIILKAGQIAYAVT
ncbi:HutD family protein [Gluconobacter aidae]|uniref:HutD family protein n=1 Tax=Gluconobacter aidae TaxID=2662454 RepID=A0A7X1SRS3_9PROT|nr:HutD family protein [Gluconobacter aidae]MQR99728.1 HutD family protein [Gluconobacter aidae]